MKEKEKAGIQGLIHFQVRERCCPGMKTVDGVCVACGVPWSANRLKEEWKVENVITAAGLNTIADQLLASPSLGKPTHVGLGTGTPGANALGTPVGSRKALATKTRNTNVLTMTFVFDPGEGTGAITECGIFDASTGGNMHSSDEFAVKNIGAEDSIGGTWTWTFADDGM